MKALKRYAPILLLALVPACVMHVGRPGDDAPFHVSSWMEMLEGWRSGVLRPSWAAHANFNLGEPRFLFYPPLSQMLGAALLSVVPLAAVAQVYVWLMLVVAGVGMLALAKELLPPEDTLKAALLYMASYYITVLAILRFAMGELATAAVLPLVLLFFLRVMATDRGRTAKVKAMVGLSVALAATWMTDVPAAVVIFYTLLACVAFEAAARRDWRLLLDLVLAETAALLLSAWYLLPAMVSRENIDAGYLKHWSFKDYLLFHSPAKGLTPAMRYPLWTWAIAGTSLFLLLALRSRAEGRAEIGDGESRNKLKMLCLMACFGLFAQTTISAPLWRYLPEFGFVQFGYRFDMILGCLLPVGVLLAVRVPRRRLFVYALWAIFFLLPFATKAKQQAKLGAASGLTKMEAALPSGYAGFAEYAVAELRPAAANLGAESSLCGATTVGWQPERREAEIAGPGICSYRVALTYYPSWRVWIDGVETGAPAAEDDGTMVVNVPGGRHRVALRFVRSRVWDIAGLCLSGLTLTILIAVWWRARMARKWTLAIASGRQPIQANSSLFGRT